MPKYICMLAHLYDPKRVIFPAYIQPKLDGIRAIWKHKERKFISRQNKPLAVPQHIIDTVSSAPFDLDGELLIKDLPLNKISGAVRLQNILNERKNSLYYTIFDTIVDSCSYTERKFDLSNFCNAVIGSCPIRTDLIYDIYDIDRYHKEHLNLGYEGSIIRNNTPYEFKRSFNLLKLKPRQRIECEIIGMLEGTGKYEGMLGALTVKTLQGKIFNVGTGFTDQGREYIWNSPVGTYNGMYIIVEFRDYSEFGIPIEASFKGLKEI